MSEGSISGALAEIAVMESVADGADTFQFMTYGTVEDDLHGGDIVGRTLEGNKPIFIDVKSNKQLPIGSESDAGVNLTIGVPTKLWDNHGRLDDEGRAIVRNLVVLGYQQRVSVASNRRTA